MTKALAIDLIRIDGGTQARHQVCDTTVAEYCDLWNSKADFPPLVVFFDGSDYWLADGFHRLLGAKRAERASVPCEIRTGSKRDAILYAVGANRDHGLKRSNADKRKAVGILLGDSEWSGWSDHVIAERAGVSHTFVGSLRKAAAEANSKKTNENEGVPSGDVETVSTSNANVSLAAKRTDSMGRKQSATKKKPDGSGRKKKPEPEKAEPKPPKNGSPKPDVISLDGKLDDLFGKFIRGIDERSTVAGPGPHHKRIIALLNEVRSILTRWQRGQSL